MHLLDMPSILAADEDVRQRAEAVWRDLENDPPLPAGPTYAQMCAILCGATRA